MNCQLLLMKRLVTDLFHPLLLFRLISLLQSKLSTSKTKLKHLFHYCGDLKHKTLLAMKLFQHLTYIIWDHEPQFQDNQALSLGNSHLLNLLMLSKVTAQLTSKTKSHFTGKHQLIQDVYQLLVTLSKLRLMAYSQLLVDHLLDLLVLLTWVPKLESKLNSELFHSIQLEEDNLQTQLI